MNVAEGARASITSDELPEGACEFYVDLRDPASGRAVELANDMERGERGYFIGGPVSRSAIRGLAVGVMSVDAGGSGQR